MHPANNVDWKKRRKEAAARRVMTAADISRNLRQQLDEAKKNPKEIYGYASYGPKWTQVNHATGGVQPNILTILAARPKVGKSLWGAEVMVEMARQAMAEDKVVRTVTLEMIASSYQRRAAAQLAGVSNTRGIRTGYISGEDEERYRAALEEIAYLPIEYLTNEVDLTEEEAMILGNSPISVADVEAFIKGETDPEGKETYWWILDHIGLLTDSAQGRDGNMASSIAQMANKLMMLCHKTATGLVITHLTRASVGGTVGIGSIAGSDQIGRNADQIFLMTRPFMDTNLSEEDQQLTKDGEPAFLQVYSRDEGGGLIPLWFDKQKVTFNEMDVSPDLLPNPKKGGSKKDG